MGTDTDGLVIRAAAILRQKGGRGVDWRGVWTRHEVKLGASLILRQDLFNMVECRFRLFLDAIGYNFTAVHDRAREHRAQTGVLNRADCVECAFGTRIEKI